MRVPHRGLMEKMPREARNFTINNLNRRLPSPLNG